MNEKKNLDITSNIIEEDGFKDVENLEEMVSSMTEDDTEMKNLQKRIKSMDAKRKADESERPAKRKKLDNLNGWGDQGELKENRVDIRKWLHGDDIQELDNITLGTPTTPNQAKTRKMKQLELDFGGILRRKENETVLEGWKPESTLKGARKMTRKQLAKVNTKMTTFLIRTSASPEALEEIHEIEPVVFDTHALEREMVVAKQEKVWRNSRMITALLKDLNLGVEPLEMSHRNSIHQGGS